MYSNLTREVLEQVFTHPVITKKDLLQLTLTCKQWSNAAQKHLYKNIALWDPVLYKHNNSDKSAMNRRLSLLMRTLLLHDQKVGHFVKTISFGALLDGPVPEDILLHVATIAHICPNVTNLEANNPSSELLYALTALHRQGKLQHLEFIEIPYSIITESNTSILIEQYHQAVVEFKKNLKRIAVVDSIGKTTSSECLITPASLRLFSRLEDVFFLEFSRVHLAQMQDYLSNCPSTVDSLLIQMSGKTITPLPTVVDDDQPAAHPRNNIRMVEIRVQSSLTSEELSFLMRMLPSLKSLELYTGYGASVPHHYNMQVVAQFLKYLSLIPLVDCTIYFGADQALASISHLANLIDIEDLLLSSSADLPDNKLGLQLQKQPKEAFSNSNATTETNGFRVTIEVSANETQATFLRSILESLNGKALKYVSIGGSYDDSIHLQKVTQQSIDSLLDINMQDLSFSYTEFPLHAPRSDARKLKHLAYLDLHRCKITESYFTWLSCQLQKVDRFEFLYDRKMDSTPAKKIRIPMLYTTLSKLSLEMDNMMSFSIKLWVNGKCTTLKATHSEQTRCAVLEEYEETEGRLVDGHELLVHCAGLKELCWKNTSYKLP